MVKNFNFYLFKVKKIFHPCHMILMAKNKLQFIHKMWSNRNKVQIWMIYVVYITEVNHKSTKHFYINCYICVDSNELFISSLTSCSHATIVPAETATPAYTWSVFSNTAVLPWPLQFNIITSPCHVFCLKLLRDWFHLKNLMTFPFKAGRNDWCSLLLNQCNFIQ